MENTIGERIGVLLDALKMKKVRFAQRLNIDQSYVSQLVSGKRNPSDRTVADICREFHVSELWLRTGQGEMFPTLSEDADLIRILTEIQTSNDSFIKAFLQTYWPVSYTHLRPGSHRRPRSRTRLLPDPADRPKR